MIVPLYIPTSVVWEFWLLCVTDSTQYINSSSF